MHRVVCIMLPFLMSSAYALPLYSHVRLQSAVSAVVSPPEVGSDMPDRIITNPSLATQPGERESTFERPLKNIRRAQQVHIDEINNMKSGGLLIGFLNKTRAAEERLIDKSDLDSSNTFGIGVYNSNANGYGAGWAGGWNGGYGGGPAPWGGFGGYAPPPWGLYGGYGLPYPGIGAPAPAPFG